MQLSENDLVTLLLCSDLATNNDDHPLSDATYSAFAIALYRNNKEPKDLLSMSASEISEICSKYKNELFFRYSINELSLRITSLLKRHQQLTIVLSDLNNIGINTVTRANKELYPQKIAKKLRKAGLPIPSVIFYAGNISLVDQLKSVGLVGSRNIAEDLTAERFTKKFVSLAINSGYAISSGGAKGIDQIAFESSINSAGYSIITVSNSLKKRINDPMTRKEIINNNSLFLSLVNPSARFFGYNAMARNKIIYAISDYSMVVTCDYTTENIRGKDVINMKKGGTWVGVHECVAKDLSKLMVRDSSYAHKGNSVLINTIDCIPVQEDDLFNVTNFEELITSHAIHQNTLADKSGLRDKDLVGENQQLDLFE